MVRRAARRRRRRPGARGGLGAPAARPRRTDLHRPARPHRARAARLSPADRAPRRTRSRSGCAPSTWCRPPAGGRAARRATSTRSWRPARSSSRWPRRRRSRSPPRRRSRSTRRRPSTSCCGCATASLDLRREGMQRSMVARHTVNRAMRDYLDAHDFLEIETPILTRSTPEGARDFLVPSRLQPGRLLRAAAVAAAVQAAADGRRLRALLPDRPLLPGRGPARRPPARVHPARPRDELRRGGRRHRDDRGPDGARLRGHRLPGRRRRRGRG